MYVKWIPTPSGRDIKHDCKKLFVMKLKHYYGEKCINSCLYNHKRQFDEKIVLICTLTSDTDFSTLISLYLDR